MSHEKVDGDRYDAEIRGGNVGGRFNHNVARKITEESWKRKLAHVQRTLDIMSDLEVRMAANVIFEVHAHLTELAKPVTELKDCIESAGGTLPEKEAETNVQQNQVNVNRNVAGATTGASRRQRKKKAKKQSKA